MIYDIILKVNPNISKELRIARMGYTYERFAKLVFLLLIVFSIIIGMIILFFSLVLKLIQPISAIILWFVLVIGSFFLFTFLPRLQINSLADKIDRDMLQVSRRFLINLQSGLSIFSSYVDISKSDTFVARYFDEIVSKIYLGMPIEQTIKEQIELNPSKNFKHIQNQVLTALLTGSDVEKVFQVSLNELIHKYIINIKEYGKKLGAIAMIYMIFGTIIPTFGCVLVVIVISASYTSISNNFFLMLYFILILFIVAIQFVFMRVFINSRPKVQI